MILIPDDILANLIQTKLTTLKNNPALIDQIFVNISHETKQELQNYLTNNQINVTKNFALSGAVAPSYVIILGSEREDMQSLGNALGGSFDSEYYGSIMNAQYRIEAWAFNADLVVLLHALLKWIMLSSRSYLESQGLIRQSIGGGDLEPAPIMDYPQPIYRRALTIDFSFDAGWKQTKGDVIEQFIDETTF